MAKGTSASKARKESQLKKFRGEDATVFALKEAERLREIEGAPDWRKMHWATDLDSYESPEVMVMRALASGNDTIDTDGAVLKSLLNELPEFFAMKGTSLSEIIQVAQQYHGNGVQVDEELVHNTIVRRFVTKLCNFNRVLYVGINTEFPIEVPYYEGPSPRWGNPGEDWQLTPDFARVLYRIPGVYVSRRQYNSERERIQLLAEATYSEYRKMLRLTAKDTILTLKRAYIERGSGETVDAFEDLTDVLTQSGHDDKYVNSGYTHRLKTPQMGLHESHNNSSPTIEASAAALAKVHMEEIVGRNYYGAAIQGSDGVMRRPVVAEVLGLIGQLPSSGSEAFRRHVRLIAWLHTMGGSLYYLDKEKTSGNQIYREYKRMTPEMVAKEWSADSDINNMRVAFSEMPNDRGEFVPLTVRVVPEHDKLVNLTVSQPAKVGGKLNTCCNVRRHRVKHVNECEQCAASGLPESHPVPYMGREEIIHVPERVYDENGGHTREDEEYLIRVRTVESGVEIVSHEFMSKRSTAKALDAWFALLGLARHQIMQDEQWPIGPRMANEQFYSKRHPAESGRGQDYLGVRHGVKHPIADTFGEMPRCGRAIDWDSYSSYDESTLAHEFSYIQFPGARALPMVFGKFSRYYTDSVGQDRVLNLPVTYMHPEHDGCLWTDEVEVRRVEPIINNDPMLLPPTPLVDKEEDTTESPDDVFNRVWTNVSTSIALGEL